MLGSGGAQRQMVTISKLLKSRGYEPEVLYYKNRNPFYLNELNENHIPVHYIEANNVVTRALKIRQFVRSNSFDTVISFLDMPDFYNVFSALGPRTWKVITSERSADEARFNSKFGQLLSWIKKFSDKIVCNSDNARKMWLKHYPLLEDKLTTIYNTVKIPSVTTDYVSLSENKLHIVVAASYKDVKNPLNVIHALSRLSTEDKERIQINWYGDKEVLQGDDLVYKQSVSLIESYKLENQIRLNGQTKDISNIMNQADVVGLFSKFEGLPNAICEAMTLGKPIVMSRISDYDILVDKSNGVLCDWENVESIADAFRLLLRKGQENLSEMGKSSKLKSKHLFSEDVVLQNWITLFERIER